MNGIHEVSGSIPLGSTILLQGLRRTGLGPIARIVFGMGSARTLDFERVDRLRPRSGSARATITRGE